MEEKFPMKASSFDAASPYATPIAGRPVLVVESDPDQRRRVTTQLSTWGYTPLAAGTAEEALELLGRAGRVAFSVVAIRLPGMSGIELLRRAGELSASGPVIMVADNGHSSQIVEAIQAGADDFLRRPYTAEDLEQVIRGVAGRPRREPAASALPAGEENGDRVQRELAMLTSAQMREILSVIEQAARADVTVLVCGETGVGKELVARAIHAHSPRRRAAFGKVNCPAMPRQLAGNRFREDLFYRLNVINILVPPLRERREEIPALVDYFVRRYSRLFNFPEREVTPEAMTAFMQYAWPGNIRELENFIKRMIVLQDFALPRALMAPAPVAAAPAAAPEPFAATRGLSLKEISRRAVLEAEREVICRALEQCRWNRVKTAKMLKISYRALLYKIKDMGLKQDSAAS